MEQAASIAPRVQDSYGFEVSKEYMDLYTTYMPIWEDEEAARQRAWQEVLAPSSGIDTAELLPVTAQGQLLDQLMHGWHSGSMDDDARDKLQTLVGGGVPFHLRGAAWKAFLDVPNKKVEGLYNKLVDQSLGELKARKHLDTEDIKGRSHALLAQGQNASVPPAKLTSKDFEHLSDQPNSQRADKGLKSKEQHAAIKAWTPACKDWLPQIEKDLHRTFPANQLMDRTGRCALRRILAAYSIHNVSVGYCQGMNFLAGCLLLFMDEEDAFWSLSVLVEDVLPGYYSMAMVAPQVDQRVFKHLVEEEFPELCERMEALGVDVGVVFAQWFLCAFVNFLPLETCLRVWDVMFLERSGAVLFRVGLALIHIYSAALMSANDLLDAHELLQNLAPMQYDASRLMQVAAERFASVEVSKLSGLRNEYRTQVVADMQQRHCSTTATKSNIGIRAKLQKELQSYWNSFSSSSSGRGSAETVQAAAAAVAAAAAPASSTAGSSRLSAGEEATAEVPAWAGAAAGSPPAAVAGQACERELVDMSADGNAAAPGASTSAAVESAAASGSSVGAQAGAVSHALFLRPSSASSSAAHSGEVCMDTPPLSPHARGHGGVQADGDVWHEAPRWESLEAFCTLAQQNQIALSHLKHHRRHTPKKCAAGGGLHSDPSSPGPGLAPCSSSGAEESAALLQSRAALTRSTSAALRIAHTPYQLEHDAGARQRDSEHAADGSQDTGGAAIDLEGSFELVEEPIMDDAEAHSVWQASRLGGENAEALRQQLGVADLISQSQALASSYNLRGRSGTSAHAHEATAGPDQPKPAVEVPVLSGAEGRTLVQQLVAAVTGLEAELYNCEKRRQDSEQAQSHCHDVIALMRDKLEALVGVVAERDRTLELLHGKLSATMERVSQQDLMLAERDDEIAELRRRVAVCEAEHGNISGGEAHEAVAHSTHLGPGRKPSALGKLFKVKMFSSEKPESSHGSQSSLHDA